MATTHTLSARINCGISFCIESEDIIWLRVWPFHSRGADRHAGDGDSFDRRMLFQQTFDSVGRYMTFHDIAVHQCCVARSDFGRDTVPFIDLPQISYIHGIDPEPVVTQMVNPQGTTATGGTFVNRDFLRLGILQTRPPSNRQYRQEHCRAPYGGCISQSDAELLW